MRTLILHHEPDRNQGSWGFGAGTGHHLALEVESDEKLAEQKGLYEELGYTDCSEIKDRNYFHSIYCRSPGGILTECAATAEGGFTRDEPWEELGTQPAAAAVVRAPARRDREDARADHRAGGEPADGGRRRGAAGDRVAQRQLDDGDGALGRAPSRRLAPHRRDVHRWDDK